jgi:hypothetical protein
MYKQGYVQDTSHDTQWTLSINRPIFSKTHLLTVYLRYSQKCVNY